MNRDRDSDLASRTGFDREFLGVVTPLPSPTVAISADVVEVDGLPFLNYEHFSLAMSASRRMARWVAWNIDGAALVDDGTLSRDRDGFRRDPRLRPEQQILDDLYRDNLLDRGHIARRADLLWGPLDEASRANADSFFFTNVTPQMEAFNQAGRGGLWGRLEDALIGQVALTRDRISIFGGPILSLDDRPYKSILVPDEFWKAFIYRLDGQPRAKAFLLTQSLDGLERDIELPTWAPYEITMVELSQRTALDFPSVRAWDAVPAEALRGVRAPVRDLDSIVW
jgi:endonuclease G